MKAPVIFPDILLPKEGIPIEKWAVIACDQFTADPEYWDSVEKSVGTYPSTLRLILPEIYLERSDARERENAVLRTMKEYVHADVFQEIRNSAVYVRRQLSDGTTRRGVVLAVDLEEYDYHPDTPSVIRASEQTIPERLPPRAAIRREAVVELPHVLVLFDDPENRLIDAMDRAREDLQCLYRSPLMLGGGEIEGYAVPENSPAADAFVKGLEALSTARRYGYLFATGDGNHSLAAAKEVWAGKKAEGAPMDDPFRYCLVELVNVYDPGLPFRPIHRLMEGDGTALRDALITRSGGIFTEYPAATVTDRVKKHGLSSGEIGLVGQNVSGIVSLPENAGLAVAVCDEAIADCRPGLVDYVHGLDDVVHAAQKRQGVAVILPEIDRSGLFATVAEKGALPRKAFSLGEARDKRYYLEGRRLGNP